MPPALGFAGCVPCGKASPLMLAAGTWAEGVAGSPYVAGERLATPGVGFSLLSNLGLKLTPGDYRRSHPQLIK